MKTVVAFLICLAGSILAIAQNPGTLDPDFGTAGRVATPFPPGSFRLGGQVWSVLRADGRILSAAANLHSGAPFSINILGYLPDGEPDQTWGQNGLVETVFPTAFTVSVNDIAVQPDGKVLVAGTRDTSHNGIFAMAGLVIRYLPSGAIDTGFGNGGYIVGFNPADPTNPHVAYTQVAISGNRILVAGIDSVDHLRLQAFSITDGSVDSTWGNNGLVQYNFRDITATATSPWDLQVLDNGSFLVHHNDLIFKFQENGLLDSAFAHQGYLEPLYAVAKGHDNIHYMLNVVSIGVLPGGKILVSGKARTLSVHDGYGVVERYTPDGILDSSFADNGVLLVDFRADNFATNFLRSIAIHQDGSFEVAGVVKDSATGEFLFAMRRFDNSGKVDSLFGNNGLVITDAFTSNDSINITCNILIQQPNDKIILTGFIPQYNSAVSGEVPASVIMARYFSSEGLVGGTVSAVPINFRVYPNPVAGLVNMVLPISGTVTVYSAEGKLIIGSQRTMDGQMGLDLSHVSPGIYFIHFADDVGNTSVQKIIKL